MYVTESLNFGGTFLAYQGEPELFHAKYLVLVTSGSEIKKSELTAYQRSANSGKKDLLLA